jgi:predicted ATP-dependent serine protease
VVECPECARHRGVVESELLPDAAVAEAEVPERRETAATADESELATLRTEAQRLSRRIKELERTVGSGDRLP